MKAKEIAILLHREDSLIPFPLVYQFVLAIKEKDSNESRKQQHPVANHLNMDVLRPGSDGVGDELRREKPALLGEALPEYPWWPSRD